MSALQPRAVVLGSSPTGLYAVRELAAAGFEVQLADLDRGCAFASRHLSGRGFVGPRNEAFAWALQAAASAPAGAVLVPTNDAFIEALCAGGDRLPPAVSAFAAYAGVAPVLLDKQRFHDLCLRHGVATPRIWRVEGREALAALAGALPFPCILKPLLIHRAKQYLNGQKVLLVENRAGFERVLAGLPGDVGGWLVQEIIPGPESELTLVGAAIGADGRELQRFSGRKLRQYPAGFGSASLVSAARCPESERIAFEFLAAIGFRGLCGVEFKRDPRDGALKMIEINPRPTLWFQITHDAGQRLLAAACLDLLGRPLPAPAPQAEDTRWRYAIKDFASSRFYRRHPHSLPFPPPDIRAAAGLRRRSWPVFDVRDPLPALAEPLGYLRKAWSRRR
ncbi:MAG: hypothetical protein K0M64_09315 [Rhizobium sp.]|nr:hypothetical protein [Rhizobium sp.]